MKPPVPPGEEAKPAEDDASTAAAPGTGFAPGLPSAAVAAAESEPPATPEDETASASAPREFTAPLDAAKEVQRERAAESAPPTPTAPSTYGSDLKAARERMDVTPADIAASLHLDESVIRAVEAGEANNLPAPVYVRGYIRAYANLVGLDGDDLIANYDEFNVVPEASPPPVVGGVSKSYRHTNLPQRRPGLFIGAIVAVIVVALAFTLWGVWRNFDWSFVTDVAGEPPAPAWRSERPARGGVETTPAAAPAARNQPAAAPVEAQPSAPVEAEPPAPVEEQPPAPAEEQPPAPAEEQPPAPAEAQPPAPVEEQPSAAVEAQPSAQFEARPFLPVAPQPEAPSDDDPPAPAAADAPGEDPPIPTATDPLAAELVFSLTEDSWLEVSDRTEVVYYDMGRAEQSVSVFGQPPFTIRIGNAAGVELRYQGELVALPPHTRGGVANLVVH